MTFTGYVPDDGGLYERLTARDVVKDVAGLRRRPAGVRVGVALTDRF